MARIVLQFIKKENGLSLYAPVDKCDETALGDRKIIVAELAGNRAARTVLQNRSLHLYFTQLAQSLNDAGLDMLIVLSKLFKEPNYSWSPEAVKEKLFKPVMSATLGKEHTSKLEPAEVSIIYESLNRATSSTMGISVPFPDKYSQMQEQVYGTTQK
jgi:hypothetical protein